LAVGREFAAVPENEGRERNPSRAEEKSEKRRVDVNERERCSHLLRHSPFRAWVPSIVFHKATAALGSAREKIKKQQLMREQEIQGSEGIDLEDPF